MPESGDNRQPIALTRNAVPDANGPFAQMQMLRAERDLLLERVQSYANELSGFERVRDEFIAVASHDLKSPLTTILGGAQYIERLLDSQVPDTGKAIGWARVIQDQARTMTLLINDLLDSSRIQTGALELRRSACDMNACVATVVGRLGPDLYARLDVAPAAQPAIGQWDRPRIEQVLANLLDNALKYSVEAERISVTVEKHSDHVEVAVSDRGVGIPPSELLHVFGRFYRTEDARSGDVSGVGLGLYICDQIITAHGGNLWAESAGPHKGSRFRFTMPLHTAVSNAQATGQEEHGR